MPDETQVAIKPARGRPMLSWVGKRPLRRVTAYPAQLVESYAAPGAEGVVADPAVWAGWPEAFPPGGLLFHGDNKDVLAHLLANGFRGKVDLIYIDPPFDSGADYVRKVTLRGPTGVARLEGEAYTLGEQIQYTDIWANDNYLQFMYERLLLLRELLAESGTIFVHCDWRRVHHLRCLLDEVIGADGFVNEIVWQHQIMGGSHEKRYPKAHETILWYAKGDAYRLRSEDPLVRVPYGEYVRTTMKQDEQGRWYYERRRMSRKATPQEAASRAHTRTYVDDPNAGTVATDVWTDMLSYQEVPEDREGIDLFPTQKTSRLLRRIIATASAPGDLTLDAFCGSGTAAIVAQKLGRRWIACDVNKGAIQTTARRLQTVIEAQAQRPPALPLPADAQAAGEPPPAQLSFAVYRVNDYDLQIQHNEAVELACQHLGVSRDRRDGFFDGTLGKRLVKIVPFNHPLTPLDLEEVRRELAARPEEERDVVVVALGKQVAVDAWLEEWNRLRRQGDVPNKIAVIELRSDPRLGGFFAHQPARARVRVRRSGAAIHVEIEDFISPTILERLKAQAGLLAPAIDDWRAMVDSVMIDPAHDGQALHVVLADVPARKSDLVEGAYELEAPASPTTVAVKITDMLGEEVLHTEVV